MHQRTLRFFLGVCQSFNFHSLLESTFVVHKGLFCLHDEQNNTWLLVGMKFLFSCSTRCLTRSRHLKTLTSSFRGDVSPWFGYQDGQILMLSYGIFSICVIPSLSPYHVPLCELSIIVKHGADIFLSIVVAFDTLVLLGPRVCFGNEYDRFRLRAPSVSTSSTGKRFCLAQRPLGSTRSISCVFSNPIICSRAFL